MESSEHILIRLSRRYPQLLLPLSYETRNSQAYRDMVLRGQNITGIPDFSFSPEDRLIAVDTPAGRAEVLYLAVREDFEHCLQALAYRCEPRPVLPSVGANTISGLINWEKIYAHKAAYEAAGGARWGWEFRRFTADKSNYCDTILLLSGGWYSAVPPEALGLSDGVWREKSLTIRQYHELTHFICRRLYPEDIDALRDEVFADAVGITAAFGAYDPAMAARFLGVEGETYRPGGRLEHYLSGPEELGAAQRRAAGLIRRAEEVMVPTGTGELLDRVGAFFEKIR